MGCGYCVTGAGCVCAVDCCNCTGAGSSLPMPEKCPPGSNRVSASKPQQIISTLKMPVALFFKEGRSPRHDHTFLSEAPSPNFLNEFLATKNGPSLVKAFTKLKAPGFAVGLST